MLGPVTALVRAANTAGTVYLCGQVGLSVFKKVREIQIQHVESEKIRQKFIDQYVQKFGKEPTAEEISVTLETFNAVERPLHKAINDTLDDAKSKIKECVDIVRPEKKDSINVTKIQVEEVNPTKLPY